MLRFVLLIVLASLVLAEMPQIVPRYLEDGAEERVVGGEVAHRGSWPWQISLQYKNGNGYRHTCGGTLVQRGWVMTAAHCVDTPRTWRVVLGDNDFNTNAGTEQVREVSEVFSHSNWDSSNVAAGYDIALLRLSKDATLNPYVLLGALPTPDEVLPHDHPCYITGWGLTATGGEISTQLKQAFLPVVDHETCSSGSWWGSTVQDTMVCAGGGSDSGCNGDSGGPLNCKVEGKYVIHGVASFVSSQGCNTEMKPTVFTRVSAYLGWMEQVLSQEALSFLEDLAERDVGGEVALPQSWPWQASVQVSNPRGSPFKHMCGGVVLNKKWILTAAHCVETDELRRIVLGDHNLTDYGGQEIYKTVGQVYLHPEWNSTRVDDGCDIALLRLHTDAAINKYVQPATLPKPGDELSKKTTCYVTGWGMTKASGEMSMLLKQVYLPLVDSKKCSSKDYWGTTVKDTMVCAGEGDSANCQGDSGGPLNCLVNGRPVVYGITSFVSARGCSQPTKPTVFTHVSAFSEWIESTMKNNK